MITHRYTDSSKVSNLNYQWAHHLTFESSIPGESLPLPPRTFRRGEMIEKIVNLAENFIPIALIGARGIGKTSVAFAVLYHDQIKQRFGNDRRFVRCDQFPPSCRHLLPRFSDVVGAGIESAEDLTLLRASLSLKEMLMILDPQATDAEEMYAAVKN